MDAEIAIVEKEAARLSRIENANTMRCELDKQTSERREEIARQRAVHLHEGGVIAANVALQNQEAREKTAKKVLVASQRQADIIEFTRAEVTRKKAAKDREWALEAAQIATREANQSVIEAKQERKKADMKANIIASAAGNEEVLRYKALSKIAEQRAEIELNRVAVVRLDAIEAARVAGIDATKQVMAAKLARMGDFVKAKEDADKHADAMMEESRLAIARDAETARLHRIAVRRAADIDFKSVVDSQLEGKREVKRESKEEAYRMRLAAEAVGRDQIAHEAALKSAKIDAASTYAAELDILCAQKKAISSAPDVTPLEATFTAKFLNESRQALAKGQLKGF